MGSNGENSVMMLASSMKPKREGDNPWKTRKKVEHGREKKKKQITKGELRRGSRWHQKTEKKGTHKERKKEEKKRKKTKRDQRDKKENFKSKFFFQIKELLQNEVQNKFRKDIVTGLPSVAASQLWTILIMLSHAQWPLNCQLQKQIESSGAGHSCVLWFVNSILPKFSA